MSRYIKKQDKREKIVASNPTLQVVVDLYIERDTDLSDSSLSEVLGMNLRTFKRRKNELVNEGLLEVRKIGARTYEIAIGKLAIMKRDKLFESIDMKKILYKLYGKDGEEQDSYVSYVPSLSPEDAAIWEDVIRRYPMPTEEDIVTSIERDKIQ